MIWPIWVKTYCMAHIWDMTCINNVTYWILKPVKVQLFYLNAPQMSLILVSKNFSTNKMVLLMRRFGVRIFFSRDWADLPRLWRRTNVSTQLSLLTLVFWAPIADPYVRHGMLRNIQMTYLAFGLLVDKEPILKFNLIIWILNLMVLVVGIGTVRKKLSHGSYHMNLMVPSKYAFLI